MRPVFEDIDGDNVTDIIMPAEVQNSPGSFELRACSGRDGKALWHRPYSVGFGKATIWRGAVMPIVTDLDGDNKPELIGLEYVDSQADNGVQQRHATIFVLEAASDRSPSSLGD